MNAFYNSDEDIAWGKVTPSEIKRHVKSQTRKKPQKRHSTNLSYSSKETMGSSVNSANSKLNDITNKYDISGTSTQYFTANDTLKSGTKNSSYLELPRIHVHPEMMLDNFQATLVNNTLLSDDAGYDISVISSGNEIYTPPKNDEYSVILISDDDSEDQNGHHSSFDLGQQCGFDRLSKLKCERLSNYKADTSDYHENVSIENEDVSEGRINTTDCTSLSSVDEDSEKYMSTERHHEYVITQDNHSEKYVQQSIILEEEVSQPIQESLCGYNDFILGNEMGAITGIQSQSSSEIDSMPHIDCQPENEICYSKCDDCDEQYDEPQNTQKDVNVTRHSSSQWGRNLNISLDNSNANSSTPKKNVIGDIHSNQDVPEKFESESPNKYFRNDSSAENKGFDLDQSIDSNNKEDFDNTLEMVERMLNQQLEIANKSVTNKNEKISTSSSSASIEESRIPRLKSPYIGDTFKVPQSIQKKKFYTPKSASKLNFKDVVSPVGLYIKYSPQPVLKQNVNAVEFKSPAFLKKIATSPQVSKPNRGNCQDFPAAIYKPSGKQITSSAKKLFLPPSLEKMVHEPKMVKHEGRINQRHNKSDIDRYLCEAELTSCSISDSVLDSSSQNISVLTPKHTFTR